MAHIAVILTLRCEIVHVCACLSRVSTDTLAPPGLTCGAHGFLRFDLSDISHTQ